MSDSTNDGQVPDGSTEITEEQKRKTEQLGDGSQSGPEADTASGGAPE